MHGAQLVLNAPFPFRHRLSCLFPCLWVGVSKIGLLGLFCFHSTPVWYLIVIWGGREQPHTLLMSVGSGWERMDLALCANATGASLMSVVNSLQFSLFIYYARILESSGDKPDSKHSEICWRIALADCQLVLLQGAGQSHCSQYKDALLTPVTCQGGHGGSTWGHMPPPRPLCWQRGAGLPGSSRGGGVICINDRAWGYSPAGPNARQQQQQ